MTNRKKTGIRKAKNPKEIQEELKIKIKNAPKGILPEDIKKKYGVKGGTFIKRKYSDKSAKYLASHYMDYIIRHRYSLYLHQAEGGVSKEDAEQILGEIVTPHQNRTLLHYREVDRKVRQAVSTLQGILQELRTAKAHLRGYLLLWDTVEKAELMINSILHEVKDTKERKRIAKAEKPLMLFVDPQIDKEGYISLETGYTKSRGNKQSPLLKSQIENIAFNIRQSKARYLSYEEAVIEFMREQSFKVKAYEQVLAIMKKGADRPAMTVTVKYSGEKMTEEGYDRVRNVYDIEPKEEEMKSKETLKRRFKRTIEKF